MKMLKHLKSVLLITFLLVITQFECVAQKTAGKIEMALSLDGIPLNIFSGMSVLFDSTHILEETPDLNGSSNSPYPLADSTKSYYLTDLSTKIVTHVKLISSSLKVEGKFPLSKKLYGAQLHPELREISGIQDRFYHAGDTIINNIPRKILMDTISRINPMGSRQGILQKAIVYLATGKKNIPISVSKTLDHKFNGWSMQFDAFLSINPEQSVKITIARHQFLLTEGLTSAEQRLMQKIKAL